jgi:hypothetical protein
MEVENRGNGEGKGVAGEHPLTCASPAPLTAAAAAIEAGSSHAYAESA